MAAILVAFLVIGPLVILAADLVRGRTRSADRFAGPALNRQRPVPIGAPAAATPAAAPPHRPASPRVSAPIAVTVPPLSVADTIAPPTGFRAAA